MDVLKQAADQASKFEHDIEDRLTVLWHEIQEWQKDNHYITSGYRPASGSYKQSWKSLGYLHNETVNIYTHLIGAIVALAGSAVIYGLLAPRYETATTEDILVFGCFFAGAAACLGMSATYHTISNHSPEVAKWGNQLDYMGIVFLIWGSFIPSIYYGFHDEVHLVRRYWTMITTIGAGTAMVTLSPKFRSPQWRRFRAMMFVAMGLSAVVPVFHGLRTIGREQLNKSIALHWLVLQGFLYILGATIYTMRVPERWAPGRFDIWGSSHQIFHVLVLAAAAVHLVGLIKAFDYRHSQPVVSPSGLFDLLLWARH